MQICEAIEHDGVGAKRYSAQRKHSPPYNIAPEFYTFDEQTLNEHTTEEDASHNILPPPLDYLRNNDEQDIYRREKDYMDYLTSFKDDSNDFSNFLQAHESISSDGTNEQQIYNVADNFIQNQFDYPTDDIGNIQMTEENIPDYELSLIHI